MVSQEIQKNGSEEKEFENIHPKVPRRRHALTNSFNIYFAGVSCGAFVYPFSIKDLLYAWQYS